MQPIFVENSEIKIVKSAEYNSYFEKNTGFFARWGKTKEDDPEFCPFGPEILDWEIVAGGNGVNKCRGNCCFCYKGNNHASDLRLTSCQTVEKVLAKMPPVLTQVAYGITNVYANPEFLDILRITREIGIIPNYTTHGLDVDKKCVETTRKYCGAVAVSIVDTKKSFESVEKFLDSGMSQVNIHFALSIESYPRALELIKYVSSNKELSRIKAIVFLQYKHKNPTSPYHSMMDLDKYLELIRACQNAGIGYGFDSCSARMFELAVDKLNLPDNQKKQMISLSESCESFGLFSSYCNVDGIYYPCSFCEGRPGWEDGLDVVNCIDFLRDIWYHQKMKKWRNKSLSSCYPTGCRKCLIYSEINP